MKAIFFFQNNNIYFTLYSLLLTFQPANILVNEDGQHGLLKLGNFGCSGRLKPGQQSVSAPTGLLHSGVLTILLCNLKLFKDLFTSLIVHPEYNHKNVQKKSKFLRVHFTTL